MEALPIDLEARKRYAQYTYAHEAMLNATHTVQAPWTLVDFNDQRLGRLTLIEDLLKRVPDMRVVDERPALKPLRHKLLKETFSVIQPSKPTKS